ncbi:zinc finger protein interacting with ribonucleoprotein K-like isoform X2 [Artemia franciscana]|uniref:zinc finger protein interacting with ribonucleoprotein K-like isoform X2 n=1 Tax=Artemia franciscana TaxID=6661 RepID=UPI0032DBDDDB
MIKEFEEKVRYAVNLVKLLNTTEKLEAVTIWNNFSVEFQAVIDSTVGKNPPVGFGKCFSSKMKNPDSSHLLDLSVPSGKTPDDFLVDGNLSRSYDSSSYRNNEALSGTEPSSGCDKLDLEEFVSSAELPSSDFDAVTDPLDSWEDLLSPAIVPPLEEKDLSSQCRPNLEKEDSNDSFKSPYEQRDLSDPYGPSLEQRALSDPYRPTSEQRDLSDSCRPSVITDNRFTTSEREERRDHPCSICHTTFHTREQLIEHLASHAAEKPFVCLKCNAKYRQLSSLNRHMLSHEGVKNFECSICKRRFAEKKTLEAHSRTHTGERPFVCEKCGRAFAQQSTLSNHDLINHQGAKRYSCQTCQLSFFTQGRFKSHMNKHQNNREFKCGHCSKAFFSKDDRNRHHKSHFAEKTHKCDKCGRSFRRKYYLKKHLVSCLKGPADLTCPHCSKVFPSFYLFSRHRNCALKSMPPSLPPLKFGQSIRKPSEAN